MATQLQQFFKNCDQEGNRSVDVEAFRGLCGRLNITAEDADIIFEDLDHDRDGRISFADFSTGFTDFISRNTLPVGGEEEEHMDSGNPEEVTKQHVWSTLTNEAEHVGKKCSDESKLKYLFNELQMSEQRHLVPYLENAVEDLLNNMNQLQDEKLRLEETWKREKQEHGKHLKRMEEEMDHQVKEAELKMRLKVQEEVEDERKTLQSRMDCELDKLQSHLKLVERVYAWLRSQPGDTQRDRRLDEVHVKLDDAVKDNRQLRMSLLDTQTSIALMRTELLQLRTLYDEKCRELSSERERILEVLQEQDHLSRQLNLMHDTNKRLLDSHDVLRSTIESPVKQIPSNMKRCKSGSIIGDYLESSYSHDVLDRFQEDDEDENESLDARRLNSIDGTCLVRRRPRTKDRQKAERHSLNHSDSGVSTVRDSGECDEHWARSSPQESDEDMEDERQSRRDRHNSGQSRNSRATSMPPPVAEKFQLCEYSRRHEYWDLKPSNSQDSLLNVDSMPKRKISDIKKQLGIEDKPVSWTKSSLSSSPLQCSTPKELLPNAAHKGYIPTPMPRMSKINAIYESIDDYEKLETSVEVEKMYEPTGTAEQTFKVIFVGDAGVGKSSFALRISKGVFVKSMSSTLGLDFLMRTLRVDGKNVAVQLWDTAGQERFRSITKTYFRKADGVMLLYDCTCEYSFLNVRQWVEDIDESCFYSMMAETPSPGRKASSQRIPLMIIANKIDLREIAHRSGTNCISRQQGEKLAKDCNATFMEASAKDGSNVLHSLVNLIRSMSTHQDLQLSASTMQLAEFKPKKSNCCGK